MILVYCVQSYVCLGVQIPCGVPATAINTKRMVGGQAVTPSSMPWTVGFWLHTNIPMPVCFTH